VLDTAHLLSLINLILFRKLSPKGGIYAFPAMLFFFSVNLRTSIVTHKLVMKIDSEGEINYFTSNRLYFILRMLTKSIFRYIFS
jgi:hypothetical protein